MLLLSITIVFFCTIPNFIHGVAFSPFDYQLSGRAMAANQHLVVAIRNRSAPSFSAVRNYTSSSPDFCSLSFSSPSVTDLYAMMIAVGENIGLSRNINRFVFVAYSQLKTGIYLVVTRINFGSCSLTTDSLVYVYNTTYPEYSTLSVNSDGDFAVYIWGRIGYMQQLNSTLGSGFIFYLMIPSAYNFVAISIELKRTWGILAGYQGQYSGSTSLRRFRPTFYVFDLNKCYTNFNTSCSNLATFLTLNYLVFWHVNQAPALDFLEDPYNPLYDISISIKDSSNIVVGIQTINIVYRLTYTSFLIQRDSRTPSSAIEAGFGKSVAWLDSNTLAILSNRWTYHYSIWYSSRIDLYPISYFGSLSSSIPPHDSFPNGRRKLWSTLNSQIVEMTSPFGSNAVILMDVNGIVYIITSSGIGMFAETRDAIGPTNGSVFVAPVTPCVAGSIKNQVSIGKDLFLGCTLCPEGTFYRPSASSVAGQCTTCNSANTFCPYGAVNNLSTSILDSVDQLQTYPETPENDVLEDILLLNMFNVDFPTHCLTKQPLFWALIIIGVGILILVLMGILKITRKCVRVRRILKLIFKQTDLIGEGELWIGGVASFAILVICVFAYQFSSGFINQYPIDAAGESTFACESDLINSKFSTSMQSLATPVTEVIEPLFKLLDEQPFTLMVDFLNTALDANKMTVMQVAGSYRWTIPSTVVDKDGILYTSTNLSSHNVVIQFNLSSDVTAGAIRISLLAPSNEKNNYLIQELNFTQVFNYTNRIMTQDPEITVQLIRLVNETQPLSTSDDIEYSGLWIPTFIYTDDQLFYSYENYLKYHTKDYTILTLTINEASYFIYNVQEPITRITEMIFTNILFSTMCIELFALSFLFYKLAIHPLIRIIIAKCSGERKVGPIRPGGCPYCRPFDISTLPSYQVPIQRPNDNSNAPLHTIQRRSKTSMDPNDFDDY